MNKDQWIKFDPTQIDTMGDIMRDVVQITDSDNAKEYVREYVDWMTENLSPKVSINEGESRRDAALRIVKSNISYSAGYHGKDTYNQILTVFDLEHPFFGKEYPTTEEAFKIGLKLGQKMKDEEE